MYKRKKGQAISKAKKHTYNGVEYKSGLEVSMAKLLTEEGIYFGYEQKSFVLQESFDNGKEYWERQSNGKGEYMKRTSLVRSITYCPDFIGEGFVVETKGYAGESFPLRYKMFKNHVKDLDVVLYKPQNQKECRTTLDEILKREVWKPIAGVKDFEDYYEVSNYGRVRSLDREVGHSSGKGTFIKTGKPVLQHLDKNGYKFVNLHKNGKSSPYFVHRLVLLAFSSEPEGETVNHIDEVKISNGLSNLEWMSIGDNARYSNSKPVLQMSLSGEVLKEYTSAQATSIDGFCPQNVGACCLGSQKTSKGYKWKFKD